jgi:hypothetical protein
LPASTANSLIRSVEESQPQRASDGKAQSLVAESDACDVDLAVSPAEKAFTGGNGIGRLCILLRIAAESDKNRALGRSACKSFIER